MGGKVSRVYYHGDILRDMHVKRLELIMRIIQRLTYPLFLTISVESSWNGLLHCYGLIESDSA